MEKHQYAKELSKTWGMIGELEERIQIEYCRNEMARDRAEKLAEMKNAKIIEANTDLFEANKVFRVTFREIDKLYNALATALHNQDRHIAENLLDALNEALNQVRDEIERTQ
jgi:DNA-binding Xre family transcriptional regulator